MQRSGPGDAGDRFPRSSDNHNCNTSSDNPPFEGALTSALRALRRPRAPAARVGYVSARPSRSDPNTHQTERQQRQATGLGNRDKLQTHVVEHGLYRARRCDDGRDRGCVGQVPERVKKGRGEGPGGREIREEQGIDLSVVDAAVWAGGFRQGLVEAEALPVPNIMNPSRSELQR